jgi:dipeptide transport system ATP-binding protein
MLLSVKNLNITFQTSKGPLHAVRDLSFTLERGETLGVVGESGCGKSITNLALLGLLPTTATVQAKELNFAGQNLMQLSEGQWQKLRGGKISMIFQDPMSALNPCYSVGYQLEETLKLHTNLNNLERHQRAIELLGLVGIPAPEQRMRAYPHELSGGMAQRVMIAMAVACDPDLLIADEPTTALDVTIQDQILRLLKDLQAQKKMAMILVTHDLGVVAQNADRIQVMYAGEAVEADVASSLISNPKHPYTKGLLDSLPGHGQKNARTHRQRLPSIQGVVPNLFQRAAGCQFAPRCSYAKEQCHQAAISLEHNLQAAVRCLYPIKYNGGQNHAHH